MFAEEEQGGERKASTILQIKKNTEHVWEIPSTSKVFELKINKTFQEN